MLRALVMSPENKAKAQAVVDFASKPENLYEPGPGAVPPGERDGARCRIDDYRCVFSITKMPDGQICRHLSISVPGPNLPNVCAAYTLATWFGFTGARVNPAGDVASPGKDWIAGPHSDGECVVIAQPLKFDS